MFEWITHYWEILLATVLLLTGVGLIRFYLGSHFSWPVFIAGLSFIIFLFGKIIGRDNERKSVKDILDKREQAYEEIDNRHTTTADVTERLRNGRF